MKIVHAILFLQVLILYPVQSQNKIKKVNVFGYENCIEIKNPTVRVVLDPNVGGRLLVYEINGKNILFENRDLDGRTWKEGDKKFEVSGGRFDIGPERTTTNRVTFYTT